MGRFPSIAASKAKTGAQKAKVYSSYAKEIYQVAKTGGTDPEGNLNLRHLIEKAKKEQVPADVIKRAIDKVNSGADESYTSVRYEGFANGGATVIVDCLTDNVNRTVSLVRNAFTKSKGKMGVSGSVSHMYEHLSVLSVNNITEDEVLEALLNAGVDAKDVYTEDGNVNIYGDPADLYKIKDAILNYKKDANFLVDEVAMVPNEMVILEGEDKENFEKLLSMLDDVEDVQKVYHNVEL
ncbi:MAG TPA: YebC/PmpR family DNA-binding transcriptional regulator [Candidatus Aphodocola excrementigallinarum]|uniref:Probable transcriptional regulatory protein IAB68_04175 n=1 Tax=Candidatus Aphodocola excrementigallinarum TaxID=2840670 RepID=A0A9D1IQW3_9FIRM|nr:YebC/PmpR family DNA-binding transcriptional regulator [Candidatus Aphodocola excrementigallinarum]